MSLWRSVRDSGESRDPVVAAACLWAGVVFRQQQGRVRGCKGEEMPQPGKSHHELEAGPGTRQGKC